MTPFGNLTFYRRHGILGLGFSALATMMAGATYSGCTLHQLVDGSCLLSRWNCFRALPCSRAPGDLQSHMGGQP
jgi:hypothetical protein